MKKEDSDSNYKKYLRKYYQKNKEAIKNSTKSNRAKNIIKINENFENLNKRFDDLEKKLETIMFSLSEIKESSKEITSKEEKRKTEEVGKRAKILLTILGKIPSGKFSETVRHSLLAWDNHQKSNNPTKAILDFELTNENSKDNVTFTLNKDTSEIYNQLSDKYKMLNFILKWHLGLE